MALKPCKECGEQVSSKADTCPNCGVNDPTTGFFKKVGKGLFKFFAVSFLFVLIVMGLFGGDDTMENADGFSTLSLNVREAPSTDHSVVTALEKGEQVKFLDDSVGWKKVELIERDDSPVGWASGKYIKDISEFEDWEYEQNEKELGVDSNGNEQQQGYQVAKTEAYVMIQDFVKDRLKSPSTAEFPWSSEATISYMGNREYSIHGYVDSENGFGAMIRTRFSGTIRDNGESWTLTGLNLHE